MPSVRKHFISLDCTLGIQGHLFWGYQGMRNERRNKGAEVGAWYFLGKLGSERVSAAFSRSHLFLFSFMLLEESLTEG